MFNKENLTALQGTCVKIANLCAEQIDGDLMFSQKLFLGALIKEFTDNPIIATSGIITVKN